MHRRDIKFHPLNPRTIEPKARAKLKKGLNKFGLLEPVIVNKRTNNLVGGHQRLSLMDSHHRGTNYKLHVAAVDLDQKTEMEAMVLLNNETASGEWDYEKLGALYKEHNIGIEESGFDLNDYRSMFGEDDLANRPADLIALADQLREAKGIFDRMTDDQAQDGPPDTEHDTGFYVCLVFRNSPERFAFTDTLDLPADTQFISGDLIMAQLTACGVIAPEGENVTDEEESAYVTRYDCPCPRCLTKHSKIIFRPLKIAHDTGPASLNYWAPCPTSGEPIVTHLDPSDTDGYKEAAEEGD